MPGERLARILSALRAAEGPGAETGYLCAAAAGVLQMTGAGIMLMSGDVPAGSLCSTNDLSALIEDLQYTLGEGPCVDAYAENRPVLEPDLADPLVPRWLAFTPAALAGGVRAIFGFPLQLGAVRLGALNFYRDRPGLLSAGQHADSLVLAGVVTRTVLAMQAKAPLGALGAEIEAGADLRAVVHQAAGMVAAQLGVSVGEALIRLRAYAFARDLPISEVADDVVSRRLRFGDPDAGT